MIFGLILETIKLIKISRDDILRAGNSNHCLALLRALLECRYYSREGLIWGNTVCNCTYLCFHSSLNCLETRVRSSEFRMLTQRCNQCCCHNLLLGPGKDWRLNSNSKSCHILKMIINDYTDVWFFSPFVFWNVSWVIFHFGTPFLK